MSRKAWQMFVLQVVSLSYASKLIEKADKGGEIIFLFYMPKSRVYKTKQRTIDFWRTIVKLFVVYILKWIWLVITHV